jgi:glycopeptide antibiotics resistance protein
VFLRYNIPTLLWATVILFLTLLPAASMPKVPAWELISFSTASHAFVFLVLTVFMLRGFSKQWRFPVLQQYAGIFTLLVAILFGVLIELLQMWLGWGRQGDVMDILSNTIGTLFGLLTYYILCRLPFTRAFLT